MKDWVWLAHWSTSTLGSQTGGLLECASRRPNSMCGRAEQDPCALLLPMYVCAQALCTGVAGFSWGDTAHTPQRESMTELYNGGAKC